MGSFSQMAAIIVIELLAIADIAIVQLDCFSFVEQVNCVATLRKLVIAEESTDLRVTGS